MQKKFSSFAQKVSTATGHPLPVTNTRNKLKFIRTLRPCARWVGDGIDHINISSGARTELGRALSPSFILKFVHDAFGEKTSISNLWNDVDKFVGSKAVLNHEVELPFILLDAAWQRIKQYPKLADELLGEALPIDMYSYNEADLPFRRALAYWWLEGIYAIREALVESSEYPNFDSIIYGKETDREKILSEFLNKYIPNRRGNAPVRQVEQTDVKAPSLVKQLRSTPPMVLGKKKFGITVDLAKNGGGIRPPKPVVVKAAPIVETVVEVADIPVSAEVERGQTDVVQHIDESAVQAVVEETSFETKKETPVKPKPMKGFDKLSGFKCDSVSEVADVAQSVDQPAEDVAEAAKEVTFETKSEEGYYTEETLSKAVDLMSSKGLTQEEVASGLKVLFESDEVFTELGKLGDFEINLSSEGNFYLVESSDGKVNVSVSSSSESNVASPNSESQVGFDELVGDQGFTLKVEVKENTPVTFDDLVGDGEFSLKVEVNDFVIPSFIGASEETNITVSNLLFDHLEDPMSVEKLEEEIEKALKADPKFVEAAKGSIDFDLVSKTHCFGISTENGKVFILSRELNSSAVFD